MLSVTLIFRILLLFQINAKYDPDIAEECLEWVQDLLIDAGEESDFNIDGSSQNFHSALKDGVILAK